MDVAVLAGGPSAEHDVSLQTGANMLALLRGAGHRVRPVAIDRENRWRFGDRTDDLATAAGAPALALEDALAELLRSCEIACIALHGRFGEDGRLQARLEALGVPFTGSGSHASAIGMDKELSKLAAVQVGARTATHEVVGPGKVPVNRLLKLVGLPCFVKPVRGGSSVGVTRVRREEELEPAVRAAAAEDDRGQALVEAAIEGVEVTCGVLRLDGRITCLPLIAIRPAGEAFYDYHAKYVAKDTRFECPAAVPPAARAEIERVSTALFAALELRGVVRFDFMLRPDGAALFLELNTLPGFTGHSLVPLAARTAGRSPADVLEACLQDALAASGRAAGSAP
ncbi:MAG TPA: D-alanine--D-alanine ligase [Planctomycetota bacterium]|nr:D-alanine--D-alanine ligase [Planctomycetota bacterium]